MRVLDCVTKEELVNDVIAILQTAHGNLFYCERLQCRHEDCATKFYVKRGTEMIAELLYDEINVIAVYGNEIVFTSKGKIHKVAITVSTISVSFVRDLHKGKAIYLVQRSDIDERTVRKLCDNIIVSEFNYLTPSWSWSHDFSPFIYFGDNSVMHTVNVETMEFPRPLRFEHRHDTVIRSIESIVGIHNGVMSMICVKTDGKSYLMSARLPVRYYTRKEPIAQTNERVED